mmetsp:Transcript_4359/g.12541  ORF Transcript_4359/g.12541 Transcript_4359/m.12541 type:complete len:116 (+) Transcript_4359:518-865(+)
MLDCTRRVTAAYGNLALRRFIEDSRGESGCSESRNQCQAFAYRAAAGTAIKLKNKRARTALRRAGNIARNRNDKQWRPPFDRTVTSATDGCKAGTLRRKRNSNAQRIVYKHEHRS